MIILKYVCVSFIILGLMIVGGEVESFQKQIIFSFSGLGLCLINLFILSILNTKLKEEKK